MVVALLAGCSGAEAPRPELVRAEAVMQEHPDSALRILDGVEVAALKGEEERASHALLLSEARIKTGQLPQDYSAARTALARYGRDGVTAEHMKAL